MNLRASSCRDRWHWICVQFIPFVNYLCPWPLSKHASQNGILKSSTVNISGGANTVKILRRSKLFDPRILVRNEFLTFSRESDSKLLLKFLYKNQSFGTFADRHGNYFSVIGGPISSTFFQCKHPDFSSLRGERGLLCRMSSVSESHRWCLPIQRTSRFVLAGG